MASTRKNGDKKERFQRYTYGVLLAFFLAPPSSHAQNYQALQGSRLGGSLSGLNNPAGIVNTPYKWDIAVFGIQGKSSSNFLRINAPSLLSSPNDYSFHYKAGTSNRYARGNVNLNLLNTRISINRQKAFAFGANLRVYGEGNTSTLSFRDVKIDDVGQVIEGNTGLQPFNAGVVNNSWIEGYVSYAQILIDDSRYRLNGGATFKLSRGLAGIYANMFNTRFTPSLDAPSVGYGQSSNLERWKNGQSFFKNVSNFFIPTQAGYSLDAGFELLIKTQAATDFFDEDDFYDYRWKLGLSFLDFGYNKFRHGGNSTPDISFVPVSYDQLKEKFNYTIKSFQQFTDTLRTIGTIGKPSEFFYINKPARVVANADRNLKNDFFVNAELSINLSSLYSRNDLYVKELNFLTVTPRWETRHWGAYLPLSFNGKKQFWVGGALKAGPLVVGLYNLSYLLSEKNLQNGGGYLSLVLHSKDLTPKSKNRELKNPSVQ